MAEVLKEAIEIAERGLSWPDHKDFTKAYVALEKVYRLLKTMDGNNGRPQ